MENAIPKFTKASACSCPRCPRLANKRYIYEPDDTAEAAFREFQACGGVYPAGAERLWEDAASMGARVRRVLEKYAAHEKVIVAGHGMMIQAVTGRETHPECGEIVEFTL